MAKATNVSGSSNIWLGSKGNSRQTILYIPADITAGGGTADKPGLLFLESISGSGGVSNLGGVFMWADNTGAIRYGSSVPTDEDGSGTALVGAATAALLGAVATDHTLIRGDLGVRGVQDSGITVDDSDNVSAMGTLGCGAITTTEDLTFSNANPNILGGDTDGVLTISADTAANQGGSIKLYGNTHTSAQDIEFYADTTKVLEWDESEANWDFNSTNVKGLGTVASGTITVSSDLALATGSITSVTGSITFVNENLGTSGTLASGALTVTGAASASTTLTAGTNIIATAGYISLADNQQIRLGDSGASDAYIKYDEPNSDLVLFDVTAGEFTLSELIAGTPLNPIVTGDLTISDGQFDWGNSSTSDVSTWTFANTSANCIDIIANTQDDAHVIDINADDIGAGTFIHLDTDETSGFSGEYVEFISNDTDVDFTVKRYGATAIRGNAGANMLTVTAGDVSVADGSVTIADDDNASALSVTNNSITTNTTPVVLISSTSLTDGVLFRLDADGLDANAGSYFDVDDSGSSMFSIKTKGATTIAGTASGTDALTLDLGDITLTDGDITLTEGKVTADSVEDLTSYVKRNHDGAATTLFELENTHATGTGYVATIIQAASSGASGGLSISNKGSSPTLYLAAGAARTGGSSYGIQIPVANQVAERLLYLDGAYLGTANQGAIDVASTGVLAAGANMLRLSSTGNNAQHSFIAEIAVTAGTIAGATDGFCLQIDDDSVGSSSYAVNIDSASNEALKVTAGDVLFGEFLTVTKGVQASAVALTATVTTGVATPPGTSFVDLTVNTATHIVDLPAPVIGNVIYYVANGANAFELGPDTTTTYINGTLADATKTLTCAASGVVIQAVCSVTNRWIVTQISATGVPTGGGTPS